ncbi:MAG TPA: hypothetical protein PKD45_14980 [Flavobacteriales bacterium]|nr:hypothetical protein [Flavobacteriales bacterium]
MLLLLGLLWEPEDYSIITKTLEQTKEMRELEPGLIEPLRPMLVERWTNAVSSDTEVLIAHTRLALGDAIEKAVQEAEVLRQNTPLQKAALMEKLGHSGLQGEALYAKARAYELLWYELGTILNDSSNRSLDQWTRIGALLDMLRDLWSSLKTVVPVAELIEEALGLIRQLVHLATTR